MGIVISHGEAIAQWIAHWAVPGGSRLDSPHRQNLCLSQNPDAKLRRLSHRVTFSMGHAGARVKFPSDAPWETQSERLSRPISAPELTAVLSWRHEKRLFKHGVILPYQYYDGSWLTCSDSCSVDCRELLGTTPVLYRMDYDEEYFPYIALMTICCQEDPDRRPGAEEIVMTLNSLKAQTTAESEKKDSNKK